MNRDGLNTLTRAYVDAIDANAATAGGYFSERANEAASEQI